MHDRLHSASLITAIKTPYHRDGRIDFAAFDRLAYRQAEAGVDGLVITGTTGEGHLMHWDEQLALIAHAVRRFGDRMLIIGNTGSNSTAEAVRATELGFRGRHGRGAADQPVLRQDLGSPASRRTSRGCSSSGPASSTTFPAAPGRTCCRT
jgi:hypothetical protein